jgi:hypothetical protein
MLRRARRRKAPRSLFIAYHIAQCLLFATLTSRLIDLLRHPVFKN